MQKLLKRLYKMSDKVARGPRNEPSDFGGNLNHFRLSLGLG